LEWKRRRARQRKLSYLIEQELCSGTNRRSERVGVEHGEIRLRWRAISSFRRFRLGVAWCWCSGTVRRTVRASATTAQPHWAGLFFWTAEYMVRQVSRILYSFLPVLFFSLQRRGTNQCRDGPMNVWQMACTRHTLELDKHSSNKSS
jgi:hypothetical protein